MKSQTEVAREARRQRRRRSQQVANPNAVFDLGASGKSDIAKDKDSMVAEAFARLRSRRRV
jgi:hypothetical protein